MRWTARSEVTTSRGEWSTVELRPPQPAPRDPVGTDMTDPLCV